MSGEHGNAQYVLSTYLSRQEIQLDFILTSYSIVIISSGTQMKISHPIPQSTNQHHMATTRQSSCN